MPSFRLMLLPLVTFLVSAAPGSSPPQATGSVEGNITYQYNRFVGSRGDVGAEIVLIKIPARATLGKLTPLNADLLLTLGVGSGMEAFGIYAATADGYGHFFKDNIPQGSYLALIISRKTSASPSEMAENSCKGSFEPEVSGRKLHCEPVTIAPGVRTQLSHDFGFTYD